MSPGSVGLVAVLALGVAAVTAVPQAAAQSGPGWITLVDGTSLDGWERAGGETNWRLEEGAIVADKLSGKVPAHLVSKNPYKDFMLHVEFWASDDANSGIYLRCANPTSISDRTCYEVNIFDKRPDPTYGTGSIVYFAEVNPMPKAGGKWNTLEITAKGRQLTVLFNGQKTAEVHNGLFVEGPITLQHGAGAIKFRKVAIKPL